MSPALNPTERDRLEVLLADRVTDGLDVAERAELLALLARCDLDEEDRWLQAATAITLGNPRLDASSEAVPADLVQRVTDDADHFFSEAASIAPTVDTAFEPEVVARPAAGDRWWPWLAAAAAVALALVGWFVRGGMPDGPIDPSALRTEVVASADVVEVAWEATDDPDAAGASGDVVWSSNAQRGVMRIRGLATNDPAISQYQLWVFDRDRDERYPVDGGVFDIPAAGEEHLVAIDTKLPVADPTLFAVTVERPGGVVVSSRERLVLLASVQ